MPDSPASRLDLVGDSSRTLGLSHGYRDGAISPEVFDRGGDRLPKPGKLRDLEIADRQKILAGEREKRDREIAKLVDAGCTTKQAAEILDAERGKVGKDRKALERADRRSKAVEQLMDAHKKPAKHSGSKSGRRRAGKRGTFVCRECHLEFCEHRPVKSKGGRPATLHRSVNADARVSPETKAALISIGLNMSDSLEVLAIMVREHRSLDDVLTDFRSRKGMAAAPAA